MSCPKCPKCQNIAYVPDNLNGVAGMVTCGNDECGHRWLHSAAALRFSCTDGDIETTADRIAKNNRELEAYENTPNTLSGADILERGTMLAGGSWFGE